MKFCLNLNNDNYYLLLVKNSKLGANTNLNNYYSFTQVQISMSMFDVLLATSF